MGSRASDLHLPGHSLMRLWSMLFTLLSASCCFRSKTESEQLQLIKILATKYVLVFTQLKKSKFNTLTMPRFISIIQLVLVSVHLILICFLTTGGVGLCEKCMYIQLRHREVRSEKGEEGLS